MNLLDYELDFFDYIKGFNNEEKIKEAYFFAKKAHEWQKRKSWEDYINHPIEVGKTLWNRFKNSDLLIAWLLHDTVEDNENISIDEIYKNFWDNIWYIVDSVTKTEKSFYKENMDTENIRIKILHWWIKNIWCLLVKLADREHNLSTIKHLPNNKQIKKSFESQAIYLPLINILDFKNKNNTIDNAEKRLKIFLKDKNIKTAKEFKNTLLNTCFHNFTENIFDIVYNNSNTVVWEIQDKILFNSLLESWWFDEDAVEIIKMETNWNNLFKVFFIFKSWCTFDFSKWKIAIRGSSFMS